MAWDWERAGQGAAIGGAGGAALGPWGALGGGVLGGLVGGFAGGAEPIEYQGYHPYQYHPGTTPISQNRGAIGGSTETGTLYSGGYANAGQISDDELLSFLTQNPEVASQYGLNPQELAAYAFAPDEQRAQFMQGVRGQVPADLTTSGQATPVYDAWANVAGRGAYDRGQDWIGSGRRIMESGLGMEDRSGVTLGSAELDAARGTVGQGGAQLQDIGRQMGSSRNALQNQLSGLQDQYGTDRLAMADQVRQGMQRGGAAYNALGTRIDEGMARGGQAYGDLGSQLDYMRQVQRGEAGPSLAEVMSNRVLGEQIQNQMAMAKSGSSFNAGAQRQAALSGEQMAAQQRQQLAELRAQEQMAAQQQVGSLAQAQQQAALGLGQYGLAGGQAQQNAALGLGQYGLQGTQALAGLTGQQGDLALQAGQANLGYLGAQGNLAMGARGQEMGLLGQEMGFAANQASFADAQRARDDAMRLGLISAGQGTVGLGMGMQGQGYGMLQGQAANDLATWQTASGIASGNAAGNWQQQQYNNALAQQNADRWMNALGAVGQGVATYAANMPTASPAQQPSQQQVTGQASGQAASDTAAMGGGWNQAVPSDEKSKQDLAAANAQIDRLLRALAETPGAEQKLALASGSPPAAGGFPAARDRQGLADQTPQQWRYTPEAQAAFPAVGGEPRVGYTTQQLKRAGPAGQGMVKTDPATGYEVIDPGAAQTFTLAAIGEQEREIEELRKRLEAAEKQSGSFGVLGAAGGF